MCSGCSCVLPPSSATVVEHDLDPEVRDRVGDNDRVVFFTLLRRFTLLRVLTRRSDCINPERFALCADADAD